MKSSKKNHRAYILLITVITLCSGNIAGAQDIIFKPVYKHTLLHNTVESYSNTIHINFDKKTISGDEYDHDLSYADFNSKLYDSTKRVYTLRVKEDRGSSYKSRYWLLRMNEQGEPIELTEYISFDSDPAKKHISFSLTPPVVTAEELFTGVMTLNGLKPDDLQNIYTLIDAGSLMESFNTFKISADSVIWELQGNDSVPGFTKRMAIDSLAHTGDESRHYTSFTCRDPDGTRLELEYGTDENIPYHNRDTRQAIILMFVWNEKRIEKALLFMSL